MDCQRARDIVNAPVMVNVTVNDRPVYMERINEVNRTCTVHYLGDPGKKENVPIQNLVEH